MGFLVIASIFFTRRVPMGVFFSSTVVVFPQ